MISPSSSYNKCKNTKHREDFCDCFPLKQNELEPFEIFQLENSMIKNENLIFELFEFDEVFDNFLVDISQGINEMTLENYFIFTLISLVARRIEKEDTSKSCFKLPISPPLKIQTDNQINCIPVEDFQTNNSSGSSLLNESTLDNGDIESQKRKHKFEKTPLIASKRSKASNRINKFERRHRFFFRSGFFNCKIGIKGIFILS